MKEFDVDYIKKLTDIMKNNELTEVSLEDDSKSIVIKANGYKPVIKVSQTQEQAIGYEVSETVEMPVSDEEKKELTPIVSNMIGIFYSRPNPDSKPFIAVGDEVKEGQDICIIETIKLINKIKSDVSGRVAEICIEDGKPVEYGQVIMYIEKNQICLKKY